jgi:branched-chain amino acid transport system permease protein
VLVTLISGLATGSIYTIVAVGYNLTWLTAKVVNFAFAMFIVTGMYFTVWMYSLGFHPLAIFAVLIVVGSIIAAIEYYTAIRPIASRGDHAELVTTVGVTTALQGIILLFNTSNAIRVPFFGGDTLIDLSGGGRTSVSSIVLIVVAVVIALGTHFWSTRTRSGLAALAQSEDRNAALVLGVRPARTAFLVFVLSGVLGFVVAPFVGPVTFAIVTIGAVLAIKGFVVLAIGGLGSQLGAIIGGLVLGIIEALVIRFTDATYQNPAVYLVFILVLLLRPQGLFGANRERTV